MSTTGKSDKQTDWGGLVEWRIQEAMERGAFRDLPGRGMPLDLRRNPFLDEALEMAYKVLQDSGFAPEWIEASKEVRARVDAWRQRLRVAWAALGENPGAEAAWQGRWARLQEELARLNREIDILNLKVPMAWLHHPRLRAERELERVRRDANRSQTCGGEDP